MAKWLKEVYDLLRGRMSEREALAEGTGHMRLKPLIIVAVAMGLIYGLFMGVFGLINRPDAYRWAQLLATTVKVPALFFLTLVVTFPSLFVFSALLGVRLGPGDVLRLIVAAITVNMTVLASLGTITAFFTVSTKSYHFIKLLNVGIFATSGVIGLGFLLNLLRRLEEAQGMGPPPPASVVEPSGDAAPDESAPAELLPLPSQKTAARTIFQVWVFVYGIVGAQMGWILRPFIGDPQLDFVWFRGRESSIFLDFFENLGKLFGA